MRVVTGRTVACRVRDDRLGGAYTLSLGGESRGRGFGNTARICCQDVPKLRGRELAWCPNSCGLECEDAETLGLQAADLGFDPGEGLCQVLLQESLNWLARLLTRAEDECLNLFESQSQGAQTLDYLHTSERFFPKQAIVPLA